MRFKTMIILTLILVILLTVSAANAAENLTDNLVSVGDANDEFISINDDQSSLEASNSIGNYTELQKLIQNCSEGDTLELSKDYKFDSVPDKTGIPINRAITIDGNNHEIDANSKSRIFLIESNNVVLKNIKLINGNGFRINNNPAIDHLFGSPGGSVYSDYDNITLINCSIIDNIANSAVYITGKNAIIINCTFSKNRAYDFGGAITLSGNNSSIIGSKFINNNAYTTIEITGSGCKIDNCTLINNRCQSVNFKSNGTLINCNFVNNSAYYGSTVYFYNNGNVTNCNFTDNIVTGDNICGGAIKMYSGSVENCNFVNNTAPHDGGAIFFSDKGIVTNSNFVNNTASHDGGAIIYIYKGTLTNCNFTNNKATHGGAISMFDGDVKNCNFTNNKATGNKSEGGAIYSLEKTTVTNCNFVNNSASGNGGAVMSIAMYEIVDDCRFINNTANQGGAIFFTGESIVTTCNFTGNNAISGSAIYFNSYEETFKTFSNSLFLNNRANVHDNYPFEKNYINNNTVITFRGQNNCINAIYSYFNSYANYNPIRFTNVTYWGYNGITNKHPNLESTKEEGQNITVVGVVNCNIVNTTKVTDMNGNIILEYDGAGDYYLIVRHDADSYYTEAEKTFTNMKFNVNVTSQTYTNMTVNITAKSNIYNEIMPGKLIFILQNGTEISANYNANGIWWALHTFDNYGDYNINASYIGLDNVTINNATITINKSPSIITLEDVVMNYGDSINVTVTTEGATGITAKINDNSVSTVNNYTIPISGLDAGKYKLTVTTIPDENHKSVTKIVTVTVSKQNISAEIIIPTNINVSENSTVNLKLPEDATGTVTLTIDGKDYAYDVVKGTVNVIIPYLDKGNYNYTIIYSGDSRYSSFTNNGSLNVLAPIIKVSNTNVTYESGAYCKITVYDADDKLANDVNVVITIKDKVFKNLTTKNGIAKFKVTNVPGTYKLNITALGKTVTKTLTVKHLVTLKKITVKRSAKKLVLTATLGKINKKYLKNKKITFKFNGKKFTAKTNKKGVAKVTIKSNVLKKLKVGKKVTYQATYKKDTVKQTVKIKK